MCKAAELLACAKPERPRVPEDDARSPAAPAGVEAWTEFEQELFRSSGGAYDPTKMAQMRRLRCSLAGYGTGSRLERLGRVSMVTPTMSSRQQFHEALWASFEAQTCEDKELIVLETCESAPSAFWQRKAKEDSRLVHVCIRVEPGGDFSVGLKRNMTLHLASGEFVVNFDDDDLYAGGYAEAMVSEMRSRSLQGVTLSSWYNFYRETGVCTHSDPSSWGEWASDEQELDSILYGYGFSYAHRRQPSLSYPYPDVRFAEDAPFFLKLREVLGSDRIALKRDDAGLCMHIMHRANSAQVLGTKEIPPEAVSGLAISSLGPFRAYVEAAQELKPDAMATSFAGVVGDILNEVLRWSAQDVADKLARQLPVVAGVA